MLLADLHADKVDALGRPRQAQREHHEMVGSQRIGEQRRGLGVPARSRAAVDRDRGGADPLAREHHFDGSTTLPKNSSESVPRSRMANRNGRSAMNEASGPGPPESKITTAVAAAASTPFSSTLMKTL